MKSAPAGAILIALFILQNHSQAQPLPVAERAGAEVLSLPTSPAHSEQDIQDAIDALRRVHASFAA